MTQRLIEEILAFRDARNWKQYHTPKDLAISLSIEAAELLEVFQWSGSDLDCAGKTEKIKEELADVLMYGLLMADACHLNVEEIIRDKLDSNKRKYPVELAYGSSLKYTELKEKDTTGE